MQKTENKTPNAEKDTQARKWQLTINNPHEKGFTHEKIKAVMDANFKSVVYWCMADEIGENGTYHTHLFLCGRSGIRFSTLRNHFAGAHFEMCNGTAQENKDYIKKEGKWSSHKKHETCVDNTFEESGEIPVERKGRKNNMDDIYSMIKDGLTNFQIMEQIPEVMLHMDKLDAARQTIIQEEYKFKFRKLNVTYLYGDSRTGKTRSVLDAYGYDNVYRVTDYMHPFDNYLGQDVILFDEFRDSFRIGDMLNYLDPYPLQLPCRYYNKYACYTNIYIASNISLAEQYKNCPEEDKSAFYHRIDCVKKFTANGVQRYKLQFPGYGFRMVLDGEFVPFLEGGRYVS